MASNSLDIFGGNWRRAMCFSVRLCRRLQMNRGERRNLPGSLLRRIPDAPLENAIFSETERKNRNKPHDRSCIVFKLSHSIPLRISMSRLAYIITEATLVLLIAALKQEKSSMLDI